MSPASQGQSPQSPETAFRRRPSTLVRYAGIYSLLWRNSVIREMNFKMNFLLWIVVELLWFGLQLCFINVIYLHTDHIASWNKWEVLMLVGASHLIQEIYQAFFLNNVVQLSELVRTGKLDFMLLLPVNTRFVVSMNKVDLGSFVNAATAVAVITYGAHKMALVPSAMQVVGFLLLCLVGILIHYSLMFALASVSFWTVRAQGIVWGYYNLFNISRLPADAFRGLFKAFFTFAIPMLLVANVPVKLLAEKLKSPMELVLLVGLAAICAGFSEIIWRYSVRHYTSASS